MMLTETNIGTAWSFTDAERADFAYICACMPTDRMTYRETKFINQMEAKFRTGHAGYLTQAQWDWFAQVAKKYGSFIQGQETAVADIRTLAAKLASGDA